VTFPYVLTPQRGDIMWCLPAVKLRLTCGLRAPVRLHELLPTNAPGFIARGAWGRPPRMWGYLVTPQAYVWHTVVGQFGTWVCDRLVASYHVP
jgi:hypothetical protein